MSKHTPGPWTVQRDFRGYGTFQIVEAGERERSLLMCGDAAGVPRGEMQANARLIAAAPDLLESAESILLMLDGTDHSTKIDRMAQLRAAIAKARGEGVGR